MSRQRSYKQYKKGTFLSLPHDVMDHHDFLSLTSRACKLLLDLGRQYNGFNNGDLCAAFSVVWVGLFAYILVLVQRQRSIRRDIDWLKDTLKKETE